MKSLVLTLALLCGLVACCARSGTSGAGAPQDVLVRGTVLDAQSGEPVAEATLRGPRDTRARSDERGRFELEGLQVGDEGPLEARTEDGRTGSILLRPQTGGSTEVVIHVASQEKDG